MNIYSVLYVFISCLACPILCPGKLSTLEMAEGLSFQQKNNTSTCSQTSSLISVIRNSYTFQWSASYYDSCKLSPYVNNWLIFLWDAGGGIWTHGPLRDEVSRCMDLSIVPMVSRLWPCLATPAFASQLNKLRFISWQSDSWFQRLFDSNRIDG